MYDIEGIKKTLVKNLNNKRYEHSLRVADTAKKLAEHYGIDKEKAYIAGLVHDCARNMELSEMIKLIREDEDLTKEDFKYPEILHGFAGAVLARNIFRIEDKQILGAIKFHTIGRKNMSDVEKVVYISDWIEPARTGEDIEMLRKMAYESLNMAILAAIKNEINFLFEKGKPIHINTIKLRNDLLVKR